MTRLIKILAFTILIFSCNQKMSDNKRQPITSLEEARTYVVENFDEPEETLWIAESLNDPVGMNMAIIGDGILKAGYMPNGFEQKDGYRIYKYKKD